MATQNPFAGVPLTIWPDGQLQRVRLLELPAELLSLVTAENPPRLQIKSKQGIDSTTAKEAHSVLCTPDKTYQIRQVNTSNSVYLIRPHDRSDPGRGDGASEGGALVPAAGVEAVAKCDSTVELLPTSAAAASAAVPYIRAALPAYASTGNYGVSSSGNVTKRELFSHIPLSEAECEAGWRELACFERQQPPGSYIPTAKVKVELWQSALTAAVADAFDVTSPFPEHDIPPFAIDLPGDWPHEVVVAVFASVSSPTPGGHLAINEQKAVRFTGINLLQSQSEGRPIEAAAFSQAWRDAVPEAWRNKCDLAVLQGYYSLLDNARSIKYVDTTAATTAAADASAKEAKSLGAKRKWHEKFRASKKTA